MDPNVIFGNRDDGILDITNLFKELLKISDKFIDEPPMRNRTVHNVNTQFGMFRINREHGNLYREKKFIISKSCNIPLNLILIYALLVGYENVELIFIRDDLKLTVSIKNRLVMLIFTDKNNSFYNNYSIKEFDDPYTRAINICDHYFQLGYEYLRCSQPFSTIKSSLNFRQMHSVFFSHQLITPYELYHTMMNYWNITCYDKGISQKSNLPFIFLPYNDHNKIFYTSIKICNKPHNDNICPFKFNDSGFTIRPLKSSLKCCDERYQGFKIQMAIMEVLIVSNQILEDNSIFDDSNQIVIGSELTLTGIHHIYSYVEMIFDSGNYLIEEQEKMLRQFGVKNKQGIIDILDNVVGL